MACGSTTVSVTRDTADTSHVSRLTCSTPITNKGRTIYTYNQAACISNRHKSKSKTKDLHPRRVGAHCSGSKVPAHGPRTCRALRPHSVGCGECGPHENRCVRPIPGTFSSQTFRLTSAHPRRRSEDLKTPWLLLAIYGESTQRGVFSRVEPSASLPLRAIPPADRSVLESALML